MAIELMELSRDILMLIVSGKLTHQELSEAQHAGETLLHGKNKTRLLVVAEDFEGWERSGDWGDLAFQEANDAKIECMALVGDRKWKELVLAFVGQGFREFPIEYFEHGQMSKARRWLLQQH
jgi:hypothetical protein